MPRPRLRRRIKFRPRASFFKPQGIPLRSLEIVNLTHEESEALRLKHLKKLDQKECAKEMQTSQSTFQRILSSAHTKLSKAVVEGKAVKIVN
ncbi:DUF134 domain-containing protein [Patescibacteria group bacterium]